MPKKIYDIKPPKAVQKVKLPLTTQKRRRAVTKKTEPVLVPEKVKKGFPVKEVLIGGGVVCVLLGIYFYNSLASVTIKISPKIDTVTFQEKITADVSYDNVNLLKNIIPARLLTEEKSDSQQFEATGSASNDGKATGTIKVYNKISPATPLTLKGGTHFLSDAGKYFVSLDKIVIPAMQKGVAGSINVKVQAEESGVDYNISSSKFSVPKLSGTSYYYGIWAESKTAMTGGYTGSVKKVTKDDLLTAKDVLTKKLLETAEASLKTKISDQEILLDGALTKNIVSVSTDAKEGAIQGTFTQQAKVAVSALVFKKEDLQKFAKLDVRSKLPDGKDMLDDSLDISYTFDSVDARGGIERMNAKISATSYYVIDDNMLTDLLIKKNSQEIQDVVNGKYGDKISNVQVRFWPFWVHTAPKDKNKIKINLIFDEG